MTDSFELQLPHGLGRKAAEEEILAEARQAALDKLVLLHAKTFRILLRESMEEVCSRRRVKFRIRRGPVR